MRKTHRPQAGRSWVSGEYDELRSEEEVAVREQDLQKAQDTFAQDAKALKVKLCRDFNEDLATAEVVHLTICPTRNPGMCRFWP